ncbi:unnamed protein product [Adineta ricciae]|uniref:RRM domain-containing protein n=2 Tax=Adineta ricciae TaxID=249248 RepID=A0A814JVR4_ADIRI|nr:unnamed protein product [Adineta ricciae]
MDVNCCPRNDFSFPMKNNTKEFIPTWPTASTTISNGLTSTLSSENLFDPEPKPFQDFILRNTSNIMSLEQSCVLPFQQLVLNDINPRTSPSHPFSFKNEALPFSSNVQSNINDENARPPWLLSLTAASQPQSAPPMRDNTTENIRHWIGDFATEHSTDTNGIQQIPLLSQKVFIGGVPRFATEADIHANFDRFGVFEIQWPKLHSAHKELHRENGFFHIVFHNAKSVCSLLDNCSRQTNNNACADYFIHFETATGSRKTVEVIPWNIGDNNYALRSVDGFAAIEV